MGGDVPDRRGLVLGKGCVYSCECVIVDKSTCIVFMVVHALVCVSLHESVCVCYMHAG